jgi:hypothetical protein
VRITSGAHDHLRQADRDVRRMREMMHAFDKRGQDRRMR